jgi:hypothetical protein
VHPEAVYSGVSRYCKIQDCDKVTRELRDCCTVCKWLAMLVAIMYHARVLPHTMSNLWCDLACSHSHMRQAN